MYTVLFAEEGSEFPLLLGEKVEQQFVFLKGSKTARGLAVFSSSESSVAKLSVQSDNHSSSDVWRKYNDDMAQWVGIPDCRARV